MHLRSRFQQINILVFAMLLMMAIILGWYRIAEHNTFSLKAWVLGDDSVVYGGFALVFLILSFLPERVWSQVLQVGATLVLGAVVVGFVAPREFGGDLLFLLAAALSYKYGLLRGHPWLKVSAFLALLVLVRLMTVFVTETNEFRHAAIQLVIVVVSVPMLYWIFERELLQIRRDRDRLESLAEDNQPFVEFGRNVTGIVHDFKNDLGLFSTFAQYLDAVRGEPIEERHVRMLRGYVQRLSSRIDHIMSITQASQRYAEEEGELQKLIRSAVYVFQSNLAFKRVILFSLELPEEPIWVRLPPAPAISILENLIRNACEAMADYADAVGDQAPEMSLSVSVALDQGDFLVTIRDTGPGLPFCDSCGRDNCLYCPEIAHGQTTKDGGSGVGLVSVRRNAEHYNLPVTLRNHDERGVEAEIRILRERVLGREGDSSTQSLSTVDG